MQVTPRLVDSSDSAGRLRILFTMILRAGSVPVCQVDVQQGVMTSMDFLGKRLGF